MKRSPRLVLFAVAMMFAGGIASPAFAMTENEERYVAKFYEVSGPEWINKGELTKNLREEGAPERLGLKPGDSRAPQPMKPGEAERKALEQGTEYGTPSERFAQDPVSQADDITLEECRDKSDLSSRPEGWIKNHFSYCHLSYVVAVEQRCRGVLCVTIGYFEARITLLSVAYNGLRNVEYMPHVDQVFFWGTASGGTFVYEVECAGSPNRDSCLPTEAEVSRNPAQWAADGKAILYFHSPAETPSPGEGEQVDWGVFQVQHKFRFPVGRTATDSGPETSARFDSAWYLSNKQGSIFDRVTPYLTFSVQDEPVKYSAWNIHNAQKFPADTEPVRPDKKVPGADEGDLLHRLFHDKDRRKANRSEATSYCGQRWPGYPDLGQDCDEYPFACTFEGAARYKYPYRGGPQYERMYAVKPIPSPDNQESGRRLGTWFSADRIIHDDGFYVRVPGADGTAPTPPNGPPAPPDAAVDCGDGTE